jgi:hypothetical protein
MKAIGVKKTDFAKNGRTAWRISGEFSDQVRRGVLVRSAQPEPAEKKANIGASATAGNLFVENSYGASASNLLRVGKFSLISGLAP